MSEYELIWHRSSLSLDNFYSIVEKRANVNLSGMKVPALQITSSIVEKGGNLNLPCIKVPALCISSIPWLNKDKSEFIRDLGLLQLQTSSSSFWCPEALKLIRLGLWTLLLLRIKCPRLTQENSMTFWRPNDYFFRHMHWTTIMSVKFLSDCSVKVCLETGSVSLSARAWIDQRNLDS